MNSLSSTKINVPAAPSFARQQPSMQIQRNLQAETLPKDASFSEYPTKVCCPKCNNCGMTNMQFEAGTATWVWCVLLFPFAFTGLCCLCFNSCKDKLHLCNRCGAVVGRKTANVC